MQKKSNFLPLIEINIATIFLATSGPLGRIVSLPPSFTIWARCLIGVFTLFLIMKLIKESFYINIKEHGLFFLSTGILMAIHWISYFYALQLANVALAHISIFTFPVITTLLEPLILKTRFNFFNFIAALLVFTGITIMVPEFSFHNKASIGVLIALFSAFVFALRNIYNKKYITVYSGINLMFYQLVVISIILSPSILIIDIENLNLTNLSAITALGIITTSAGHTLFTRSFKNFKVSTASIINSITPIYGTLMALIFLNEIPDLKTVAGGTIILGTVIIENIKSYKKRV